MTEDIPVPYTKQYTKDKIKLHPTQNLTLGFETKGKKL
jgi:hypothetical protein